jgi:release factor glutamine methyltransferase
VTVRSWLQFARAELNKSGIEAADLESQLLACHVLAVNRSWLVTHADDSFPQDSGEVLLARRLDHEPLAYILGWREFYGRRFEVGPGVLIPRQETEVLLECAIDRMRLAVGRPIQVLDLGTGSGCLGVSIKLELPEARVIASDISLAALEIAQRNGANLGASVDFVNSDGFDNIRRGPFDLIVSNPPYIGEAEPLPREVSHFEPSEALFGGPTGLEFFERLSQEAGEHILPDGSLLLEVGYRQADKVTAIFIQNGWKHVETRQDLSGIPRSVVFKRTKKT